MRTDDANRCDTCGRPPWEHAKESNACPLGRRVLITGSRNWYNEAEIRKVIDSLPPDAVVIHGACRTGADRIADKLASERGLKIDRFPADWKNHGKAAGPIRNRRMVDAAKPTEAYAYPMFDSKGTWDCVDALKDAGVPVTIDRKSLR